ncbi:Acyl-CoA binding domain containing 5, variant 2 [Entomophthora muscae]|uniref:Acyl-CoA binding domain containing 5, variant 2 n=1 Tax=Entomophthora muscae TaxID=34485 RepID=A0ACC2RJC8_9FUNG|nr:Acyl-CoA binding domain containing 5, variant 2 [Entomophthora muscae]
MGAISKRKFEQALTVMRQLPSNLQPTHEEKLKLYGYYKQSVYGPSPNRKSYLCHPLEFAKWEAWYGVRNLSSSEAQEHYFATVIKFLEKFIDRPYIADIVHSLERGRRISEIQVSLPFTRDYCTTDDDSKFTTVEETDSISNFHYNDSLCLLSSPTFSHETPDECSDDSSDDGASLSTCTVKAYNSSGTLTNRSSHHNLSPDAERALESLQTQVAALNERLEVMRYQLERRDLTQVKKPSSGWKSVAMVIKLFSCY